MIPLLFDIVKFLMKAVRFIYLTLLVVISQKKARQLKTIQVLERKLENCRNYNEFTEISKRIDEVTGMDKWKQNPESKSYDYISINKRLVSLTALTISMDDIHELKHQLRSGLVRNLYGMGNSKLYTTSKIGTKVLIENYVNFVCKTLEYICDSELDISLQEQFDYFYEMTQSFGRSALCLSGGATLGMYHIGVVKVLFENNLLPRIISGSSVGAIIAALTATKTDDELRNVFSIRGINFKAFDSRGSAYRKIFRLLTEGVLMDIRKLEKMIRDNIQDITFKEAFKKTNRILNITVASASPFESSRLLNYLTAPDILVWSAAAASCALSFLYKPVELMAKDRDGNIVAFTSSDMLWSDGSMTTDLPMVRLSELFNVNNFIVSQVNPHVVPFIWFVDKAGVFGKLIRDEFQLRLKQLSDFLVCVI